MIIILKCEFTEFEPTMWVEIALPSTPEAKTII